MKQNLFLLLIMLACLSSCRKDADEDTCNRAKRTVVVYLSGENELDGNLIRNYSAITKGARNLSEGEQLLIYIDRYANYIYPYIMLVNKDGEEKVKQYEQDFYSSSPTKMKEILQWCFTQYPAQSYALIMAGHGSGWFCTKPERTAQSKRRAYGIDYGTDSPKEEQKGEQWMNITQLADVLSTTPHLDYIMFDCCNMQTVEVAYELRKYTDYIIGSPAEIPASGAPFDKITPYLFDAKENVGKKVVDEYAVSCSSSYASGLPLSVIKTSEMEALAQSTRKALNSIMSAYAYPTDIQLDGLIYYQMVSDISNNAPISYDIRNFMRHYLSANDFSTWEVAYHNAVPYSVHPDDIHTTGKIDWITVKPVDFKSFYMTDENYGGVSMFIPQKTYSEGDGSLYISPNTSIYNMEWSKVVDWSQWGW